jgi:L-arabinokinase
MVDSGYRYEDLVAASDVVITKPGYGILSECASTGTAMLYTSRGRFREYDVLVDALARMVRSRFIAQDDLFAGRWREALEGVLEQPDPALVLPADGADVAAGRILQALEGRT